MDHLYRKVSAPSMCYTVHKLPYNFTLANYYHCFLITCPPKRVERNWYTSPTGHRQASTGEVYIICDAQRACYILLEKAGNHKTKKLGLGSNKKMPVTEHQSKVGTGRNAECYATFSLASLWSPCSSPHYRNFCWHFTAFSLLTLYRWLVRVPKAGSYFTEHKYSTDSGTWKHHIWLQIFRTLFWKDCREFKIEKPPLLSI